MASERTYTLTETQLRKMLAKAFDEGYVWIERDKDTMKDEDIDAIILDHAAQPAPSPVEKVRAALKELRISANRLCDRNLGGTYEEDCRRSIARADVALLAAKDPSPATTPGTCSTCLHYRRLGSTCGNWKSRVYGQTLAGGTLESWGCILYAASPDHPAEEPK